MGGRDCVFPFNYWQSATASISFVGCTLMGSEDGLPWCSTLVDRNGFHVEMEGTRGHCGRECVFPFIYKQNIYGGCTMVDSEDGSAWCSTLVDSEGIHVEGDETWGHCSNGLGCNKLSGITNYGF